MKSTEHQEQVSLFLWADLEKKKHPELDLLFAVPNGGQRNPIVGAKLKAEGVKAGVPDICLPVPCKGFHALYIELKTINGRMQKNQIEWQEKLNQHGNLAVTCFGWVHARDTIREYLDH